MPLSWNEIKSRALAFSRTWADAANEDSEAKPFWIDFFEIFGITNKRVGTFEHAVKKLLGDKAKVDGFVDLFWPGMLLVEQKSRGKNLDAALSQALSYFPGIAERDLPQIVIVCDFARFRVHRLETGETIEFALADLHKNIKLFGFIAGYKAQVIQPQNPVNIKAAERMGKLHDALKASGYSGHPLELLLVRLLFCLFADDTGIFQPAAAFRTYVDERTAKDGSDLGPLLAKLFQVLNTEEAKRSQALDEQLAAFPYVNGKLFEEQLPMADFTSSMREALLDACALDWSAISPAIFGSLFQSIMDDKARRNLGAHYTSEENIKKLIKPLFLDELWAEFEKVKRQKNKLFEFHKKLRSLTFFDPACGCGNFLVISYRELRELELAVLRASITDGQMGVDVHGLINLNVDQFFGIEIEEFPAQIAQVAMWLIDHQMNMRLSEEFGFYFARIPLRTTARVVHGNALTLDWETVLPAVNCSYVLGNPPFLGKKEQSAAQKADVEPLFKPMKGGGVLDFVAAWYVKAANYIKVPRAGIEPIRCAFVSTNSITQGEQVGILWSWLLAQGIHIHFAHRTFSWTNEAKGKAAVHCVIIGFGLENRPNKVIYEYADIKGEPHAVPANNISPYLVDTPNCVIESRRTTISQAPEMIKGNEATDDGNLILNDTQLESLLAVEPNAKKWIRKFLGGENFLNDGNRWCLWLKDIDPQELRSMPSVMEKIEAVRKFRSASPKTATVEKARQPWLFGEIRQPINSNVIVVPKVSSERREYLPIGFEPASTILNNTLQFIPNGSLFHFGVLQSQMHAAWMRATCGRLESRYQYSINIVYNNFPWPDLQKNMKNQAVSGVNSAYTAIENAAKAVLDERAKFQAGDKPASLADLYDPLTMPPALLKAHQKLDTAVDKAYEASGGKKSYKSDAERVAFLFELYQKLTSLLPVEAGKAKRRSKSIA